MPGKFGLAKPIAALCVARQNLCPFLLHKLLFFSKVRIGIHPRHQISVPLQQACCENAGSQIGVEPLCDGDIRQIGLFENLSAYPGFLREDTLQLNHETDFFVQHFEDLISRGGHVVQVV